MRGSDDTKDELPAVDLNRYMVVTWNELLRVPNFSTAGNKVEMISILSEADSSNSWMEDAVKIREGHANIHSDHSPGKNNRVAASAVAVPAIAKTAFNKYWNSQRVIGCS